MKTNFTIDANYPREQADAAVMVVPKSIESKEELMDVYARGLNFPDYFGKNWDALWDCICDLSWSDKKKIVIVHEDVADKLPDRDRIVYLEILRDAITHWQKYPNDHELEVVFPWEPVLKNEPPRQP